MTVIFQQTTNNITITLRQSQKNVEAGLNIFECNFKLQHATSAENVITAILQAKQKISEQYPFPIKWGETQFQEDVNQFKETALVDLKLTKKMTSLISAGTFLQQVKYILLIGLRDAITKNQYFKEAIEHIHFQQQLESRNIKNDATFSPPFSRIHAAHPADVEHDDEIGQGLLVTTHQHPNDNPLYVGSPTALALALEICEPNSTLVIDGHWQHGLKSQHGVWDYADAETISNNIADLININPGKISKLILLGCESGTLENDLDNTITTANLFVKNRIKSTPYEEVANFRHKLLYVPQDEESIFAPGSLARQVLDKLEDKKISVTATPALGYPYPAGQPHINIASDAPSWESEHFWQEEADNSALYNYCRQTKSVTQTTQVPNELKYFRYTQ